MAVSGTIRNNVIGLKKLRITKLKTVDCRVASPMYIKIC
jgi:hypothetical protein